MRKLDYSDSPQFRDGLFRNRLPATEVPSGTTAGMAAEMATKGRKGKPRRPVEVVRPELPARAERTVHPRRRPIRVRQLPHRAPPYSETVDGSA